MKKKKLLIEVGALAVLILAGILFMLFSRPQSPQALWEQAVRASEKADYEKASQLYLELLRLQPENTQALSGLAEAASYLENSKTAESALKKLIELEPQEWEHYHALITLYLQNGRPEQADVILQKWVAEAEG